MKRFRNIFLLAYWIQLGKFAATGVLAAAVALGSLIVLTEWFGVWYLAASAASYVLTFIVNFSFQKFWTFRNFDLVRAPAQARRFLAVSLLNLALNTILMYGLVDIVGIHHVVSQVVVMCVLAVMNFILYRTYIFSFVPDVRKTV